MADVIDATKPPEITPEEIARYYLIKNEMAKLDKEAKKLNAKIKGQLLPRGLTNYHLGEYELKLSSQDRSKVDEDKLVLFLKGKGLTDCIVVKETPNQEKVEELIFNKVLDAKEIESCIIPNIVWALTVVRDA